MNVVVPAAVRRQKSCFSPKSSPFALQTGTKWLCRVLWKSEQNYSGFANPKSWVLVRNVIPAATSHHHVMEASLVFVGPGGLCIETLAFEVFWDCQVKPTASDFIWRTSGFMCLWKKELTNSSLNKWPTEVYLGFYFLTDFRCSFSCSASSGSSGELFWKRQNSGFFPGLTLWLLQTEGIEASVLLGMGKTNLWALQA